MNIRQERRLSRIGLLKRILLDSKQYESTKGSVSYEKLLYFCQEEWGVSRRTAKEYLDVLIKGNFCKQHGIKLET